MATHDYVIDNSTGANVRADINNVLQAILTNNSSSSAPSTTAAYMWWADTANGVLKIRNSANNDWVELLQLDGTLTMETGTTASAPSLAFRGDLDTGIFQDAANHFQIATAGVERVEFQTTEVVFNDGGNDIDFRIEGDTQANLFKLDAGDDRIGVAIAAPRARFDLGNIVTDTTALTRVADRYQLVLEATDSSSRFSNNIGFILSGGTTVVAAINTFENGGNGATGLSFATSSNSSSDPVAALTIDSTGRVGIGASSFNDAAEYLLVKNDSTAANISIVASNDGHSSLNLGDEDDFNIQKIKSDHTDNSLGFFTGNLERFRVDSSGRLLVGTSTARANYGNNTSGTEQKMTMEGTTATSATLAIIRNSNDVNDGGIILGKTRGTSVNTNTVVQAGDDLGALSFVGADGTSLQFGASIHAQVETGVGNDDMPASLVFSTNGGSTSTTERMRLDSLGRLLMGTTTMFGDGNDKLMIEKGTDGGRIAFGTSAGFSECIIGSVSAYWADNKKIAAISFFGGSDTTNKDDGTIRFATSSANNLNEAMRIGSDGSLMVGNTSARPAEFLTPNGFSVNAGTNGQIQNTVSGLNCLFNRKGSDGALIGFRQDGADEGNISVSGSTVSYNGGHLSRWSQLKGISTTDKSARPTIYQGTVMSNLDELCEWKHDEMLHQEDVLYTDYDTIPDGKKVGDVKHAKGSVLRAAYTEQNQQLNMTKISDTEGEKDVAGVFWAWDDEDDEIVNDFYIAMTGDMVIRVAASTTVARGDLLISAGDGTAKPQDDDIVRSSTIAKIISTNHTATYADGSKAYPCVLMAC